MECGAGWEEGTQVFQIHAGFPARIPIPRNAGVALPSDLCPFPARFATLSTNVSSRKSREGQGGHPWAFQGFHPCGDPAWIPWIPLNRHSQSQSQSRCTAKQRLDVKVPPFFPELLNLRVARDVPTLLPRFPTGMPGVQPFFLREGGALIYPELREMWDWDVNPLFSRPHHGVPQAGMFLELPGTSLQIGSWVWVPRGSGPGRIPVPEGLEC